MQVIIDKLQMRAYNHRNQRACAPVSDAGKLARALPGSSGKMPRVAVNARDCGAVCFSLDIQHGVLDAACIQVKPRTQEGSVERNAELRW